MTNKLSYTKVKNFYLSKYTIKINKMQVTEDIYNVPDKGLYLECTKNSYKSIRRRPDNQWKNEQNTWIALCKKGHPNGQ